MRLRRDVPLLAAVLTLAGSGTPAAYGLANRAPISGGDQPTARVQNSAPGSDQLLAFGVAAGGLALVGVGTTTSRRSARRRAGTAGAPSGS
jgi:hypothetical protein